jgi:hypothetical protein
VTAGPLTLLVAGERPAAFDPPVEVKALALLRAGQTATVAVPRAERSRLSLLYDFSSPGPRRPLRLSDGTSSVRFNACTRVEDWADGRPNPDARETQFNGGFFVSGGQCAALNVWVRGRAEPLELSFSLTRGDRPCPGKPF